MIVNRQRSTINLYKYTLGILFFVIRKIAFADGLLPILDKIIIKCLNYTYKLSTAYSSFIKIDKRNIFLAVAAALIPQKVILGE